MGCADTPHDLFRLSRTKSKLGGLPLALTPGLVPGTSLYLVPFKENENHAPFALREGLLTPSPDPSSKEISTVPVGVMG